MRLGKITKLLFPGWGFCEKCQTTWNFSQYHITKYNNISGMFPLCEKCWKELSPVERLPFYEKIWNINKKHEKIDLWPIIKQAVLNEKNDE